MRDSKNIKTFEQFNNDESSEIVNESLFSTNNVDRIKKFISKTPDDVELADKLLTRIFTEQFNKINSGAILKDEILSLDIAAKRDILGKTLDVLEKTTKHGYPRLNKSGGEWRVGLMPSGAPTL